MSGCVDAKTLQKYLQSLDFTPRRPNVTWKRRLGDEGPAHKVTEKMSQGDS